MDDKQHQQLKAHMQMRAESLSKKKRFSREDITFEQELAEEKLGFRVSYATMYAEFYWANLIRNRYGE